MLIKTSFDRESRFPFPLAFPVYRSDFFPGGRQRTMGRVPVYTSSGTSFRNKTTLPLIAARCLKEVFVIFPNLYFILCQGLIRCTRSLMNNSRIVTNGDEFTFFSRFALFCDWSPRPHAAVQAICHTIYIMMAASEGDHRVQKSAAAAQRPPHLKALEVFCRSCLTLFNAF